MLAHHLAAARLLARHPELPPDFWTLVERTPGRASCWIWRGRIDRFGRPTFPVEGVALLARRVACFMVSGTYPLETRADPRCEHPHCVRPSHARWHAGAQRHRQIARITDGYGHLTPRLSDHLEELAAATPPRRASG